MFIIPIGNITQLNNSEFDYTATCFLLSSLFWEENLLPGGLIHRTGVHSVCQSEPQNILIACLSGKSVFSLTNPLLILILLFLGHLMFFPAGTLPDILRQLNPLSTRTHTTGLSGCKLSSENNLEFENKSLS